MFHKTRQTAIQRHRSLNKYFDLAIYAGFLIFVLVLPFGYATEILNAGLLLALLGWIGRACYERQFEWKKTPLDIPIAIFLVLALVASLFAPHRSTSSLGYFWKLFRAVLLFYAVVHSRLGTRWHHLVIAFIFAGGFSAALGIWYYANGTHLAISHLFSLDLKIQNDLGDGEVVLGDLRRAFESKGRQLSQDAVISLSDKYGDWSIEDKRKNRKYTIRKSESQLHIYIIEPRLAGTFKMPNDLGAYLVIALPLTMGYFVASWRTRQNWKSITVFSIALCVMIVNLAFTLTRSAWIGVFVATIYIVFYVDRRLLWGLLIFIILSLFLMPQPVKERFETIRKHPPGFMSERPQWWKTSVQLIAKYPVTGIGLGRFRYEYQLHGPPDMYHKPYHAHNIYLQVAVEQGIPSLILFLWILFLICYQLFDLRQKSDFWCSGLFIGSSSFLISALVYGLADHILHQRPLLIFWFLNGLVFYVTDFDVS